MNHKRDYYEVLGVGRQASEQEIKSAYRRLALQYHPDRNPDNKEASEEKFKGITEAYGILADPQKRVAYDRFGHAGVGGAGGFTPDFSSAIFADFEDLFGDFFGFGDIFGRTRTRRRATEGGSDLRYDMELSFEEAAEGLESKIKILSWERCSGCQGSGARKGSAPVTCPSCGGRGQIQHQQGFFTLTRTCPDCQGMGSVVRDACPNCHGEGRLRQERVLSIKIPPGVEDGTRLRVTGEGDAGVHGGSPGDLYVVLKVREHPCFERHGTDLYSTIPISISQAVLGAEIKVATLRGDAPLRIPEGTQSGSVFRLRGLGLASLDGQGKGDLYVTIHVVVPTRLSREQRRLFETLGASVRVENKPLQKKVSGKTRDIFG